MKMNVAIVYILFIVAIYTILVSSTASLPSILPWNLFSEPPLGDTIESIKRKDCWHSPQMQDLISTYCSNLNDEGRSRITIALSNCHMVSTGFQPIICSVSTPIESCTSNVGSSPVAYTTYTTFYAHVDSLCFYMRKDLFQQTTANAIQSLLDTTATTQDTLSDFTQDIQRSQQDIISEISKVGEEERARFEQLVYSISHARTMLEYLKLDQDKLHQQHDTLISLSQNMTGKQLAALEQLGIITRQISSLEDIQIQHHNSTIASITAVGQSATEQLSLITSEQRSLHDNLSYVHNHLSEQARSISYELDQAKHRLEVLLSSALESLQSLEITILSFSSLLYYPSCLCASYLLTIHKRTSSARLPLYIMIILACICERMLALQPAIWIGIISDCTLSVGQSLIRYISLCIMTLNIHHPIEIPSTWTCDIVSATSSTLYNATLSSLQTGYPLEILPHIPELPPLTQNTYTQLIASIRMSFAVYGICIIILSCLLYVDRIYRIEKRVSHLSQKLDHIITLLRTSAQYTIAHSSQSLKNILGISPSSSSQSLPLNDNDNDSNNNNMIAIDTSTHPTAHKITLWERMSLFFKSAPPQPIQIPVQLQKSPMIHSMTHIASVSASPMSPSRHRSRIQPQVCQSVPEETVTTTPIASPEGEVEVKPRRRGRPAGTSSLSREKTPTADPETAQIRSHTPQRRTRSKVE